MVSTPDTMELREAGIGAFFRPRDLAPLGISHRRLQGLVSRGVVENFGNGLYRLTEVPATELETIAMVAAAVPGESPHRERLVLKGAMLLALWGEAIYRPTRDLDFTGYGSSLPNDVRSAICDVCAVPVADDGIVFNSEALTIDPIRGQDEYDGLRAGFGATLDGARIRMRVDIGFGNAIQPPSIDAHYPVLLDAPRPRIRVYPREAVVAEKLHAMVDYGERNSRFKDFYDLHALAQHFEFDGERLVHAIGATFEWS